MSPEELLKSRPLIPVAVVHAPEDAVKLAEALLSGGIGVLEITLRSAAALEAIELVSKRVPGIIVGAGTVTAPEHIRQAQEAGAQFLVSPGLTPAVAEEARKRKAPLLPGVATASEVMRAQERGFHLLKFFPAEPSGGIGTLAHFASVFPAVRFCPTGGVRLENCAEYLACGNVLCVGGSWLTPAEIVTAKDWTRITRIARDTLATLLACSGHLSGTSINPLPS